MQRSIIETKDGSKTIHLKEWNENYHSHHGAIQEAKHVFIEAGLRQKAASKDEVRILEIGFGTGLNAILTYQFAKNHGLKICYEGVEAFPVSCDELNELAYDRLEEIAKDSKIFKKLHSVPMNEATAIDSFFQLIRHLSRIENIRLEENHFDLVYFDAFGPRVQPELWTLAIFQNMYRMLRSGGVLVTYCAKGDVRRAMFEAGFLVEKLPGPPGKREMLRAVKA